LASIGVSTLVSRATRDDPAGQLEAAFGPIVDRISAIEPSSLAAR